MNSIETKELHKILQEGNHDSLLIDVRTEQEFALNKIPDATNIPLDKLSEFVDDLKSYKKVYVHCQSGNRSSQACKQLKELGLTNTVNVEGGISQWEAFDLPTIKKRGAIPIMRQVLIAAGSLVLLGNLLAIYVHPYFLAISLAVSIGLLFSGFSGTCMMATILRKMPWNN